MNATYSQYLQSEAWAAKRRERLTISKNKCAACGIGGAQDIHHLTYARIFNEEMSDLLPLCRKHHDTAEELVKKGKLPRSENVLFLATETVRLIMAKSPKIKIVRVVERSPQSQPQSLDKNGRKLARVEKRNALMNQQWFVLALKLNREPFRKVCRANIPKGAGRASLMANCFVLYASEHYKHIPPSAFKTS